MKAEETPEFNRNGSLFNKNTVMNLEKKIEDLIKLQEVLINEIEKALKQLEGGAYGNGKSLRH